MKKYFFPLSLLISIFFFTCKFLDPNEKLDYNKRIILKKIPFNDSTIIEWFHYSLITSYSPGFIEFKSTDSSRELICESSYICDAYLGNNSLNILVEKNHFHEIKYENKYKIEIKIDTTCKGKYLYQQERK